MDEHANSDVVALGAAVTGLAAMVKTRTRRVYREIDELRRLAAQLENAATLLEEAVTERLEAHG
jgi:hypothetical protein